MADHIAIQAVRFALHSTIQIKLIRLDEDATSHRRSQGGRGPGLPQILKKNATNDKNVTKKTIVSSVSFSIFAYNSTRVQQTLTIILIQRARAPLI